MEADALVAMIDMKPREMKCREHLARLKPAQ